MGYYVHALLDYHEWSYERHGPYRWRWLAELQAESLMRVNPYGTSTINKSPEKPKISY